MSGHEHGPDCKCGCHDHDHEEHEHTSLEVAGGCAEGLQGTITGWNADAEARMSKALMTIGQWVTKESGCLLGHIKAAIVDENGNGITLNLTDIENGVECHGELEPMEKVRFAFMCAVLDVDEHELRHRMFHAIDDTGLDYELDEHVECHCHDHDHEHHHHHDHEDGCCGHDHGHEHHHEHGCGCGHHHHDHDHEHDDHCGCGHEHHHDHEDGCCCDKEQEPEKKEKKSIFDRIRRKK